MNSNNKKIIRNLLIYLGIPILLVVLLLLLFDRGADQTGLKYSDVLSYFEDGKVSAEGIAKLKERMPFADLSKFEANPLVQNLAQQLTVNDMCNFVAHKLSKK